MNITVIGGTGHVGTYLVPRLVDKGHRVTVLSRSNREPYTVHPAWDRVRTIKIDRQAAEKDGSFGSSVVATEPDAVIDMICFTRASAEHLVHALRGKVQHLLVCGTIWIHGISATVPTREDENLDAFGEYGVNKRDLTLYLLDQSRKGGVPSTIIHPGHIVGPGWLPINPLGNLNPLVFSRLARGETVAYPTMGLETIHHIHADDIARMFVRALETRASAAGEDFHCVSGAAITLRGYAGAAAGWFGKEARLVFRAPDDEWTPGFSEEDVRTSWDHISRSPNSSMAKARELLGFESHYSSLEAVYESVRWMVDHGKIEL